MCDYCENGRPSGADLEDGDEANACNKQIAESLRDSIRAGWDGFSNNPRNIDRLINVLVDRATPPETLTPLDTDVFCDCKGDDLWHYYEGKKKYCLVCDKPRRIS